MTREKLERAIDLKREIEGLQDHYDKVKSSAGGYKDKGASISVESQNDSTKRKLAYDLLPIPLDEFVRMYLLRVETKIHELVVEFESL